MPTRIMFVLRYAVAAVVTAMLVTQPTMMTTTLVEARRSSSSTSSRTRPLDRPIQIVNDSLSKFAVYWVHPDTGDTVLMSTTDIVPGADFPLNSYVGHKFEVREVGSKANPTNCSKSPTGSCRSTTFTVSENDDQVVRIDTEFEMSFVDNKVKARKQATDLIAECRTAAKARIAAATASGDDDSVQQAMEVLVNCVEGGVADTLEKVNEEIAFQSAVRVDIAATLENYTCMDDTLNSTADLEKRTWSNPPERRRGLPARTVHVKHERPASKIHVIDNFIQTDECQSMEEMAAKTLHKATVADGKGGSRLSENRKAMQAGIKVPWKDEGNDHPIARLSRRVYDYTNHVLGLNIQEFGQEDLMSIQYFGRGFNDTEPDRYTPHCDGDCTGLQHKHGTRMATMVMYCKTADRGGHTNFRNAGVHVKPEPGQAVFFSYINPESLKMDTGFTEHSGCPVFEGSKKIVTQWIRMGVDTANPWDSFNTLGIQHSKMLEMENDDGGDGEHQQGQGDDNNTAGGDRARALLEEEEEDEEMEDYDDDDDAGYDDDDDDGSDVGYNNEEL